MRRRLVLIIQNVRSAHNVGSLLRSADGLGVEEVWLCGYTPYPITKNDTRLPHIAAKVDKNIAKVALGAEKNININHASDVLSVINSYQNEGFIIAALEQTDSSIEINKFDPPEKICLIVGREVEGIEQSVLEKCDLILEINMFGKKESYNVSVAGAIALYSLRFAK